VATTFAPILISFSWLVRDQSLIGSGGRWRRSALAYNLGNFLRSLATSGSSFIRFLTGCSQSDPRVSGF